MTRIVSASLVASLLAASSAMAATPAQCPPVKPGHGVGSLRLGMKVSEVAKLGKNTGPKAGKGGWYSTSLEGRSVDLKVDAKEEVTEIQMPGPQGCRADGRGGDLRAPAAQNTAVLPDCSLSGNPSYSWWSCPAHGVEFYWEKGGSGVRVVRAETITPYNYLPPPVPKRPEPVVGDAGVEVVDRCLDNYAPLGEVACGFFGRNENVTLQCYMTNLCMGSFAKDSLTHIEALGVDGQRPGQFRMGKEERTLVLRFDKPPAQGTLVRLVVSREMNATRPEGTLRHPAAPPLPSNLKNPNPRVPDSAPVIGVVGSRQVSGAYVLDLEVPASAFTPPKQKGG